MKEKLATYSNILQLDTVTMLGFKHAPDGLARALQMFTIVMLIAGLGMWLGIPVQLDRPVLYELLNDVQGEISNFSGSVAPYLEQNIPFLPAPEEVAEPVGAAATAAGEALNELLLMAETEAELVSPPLGTRASRVVRLFGRWLSVPLAVLSDGLFLALVAMLVAKLLGGRASIGQHLTAVLLASAPLVLSLPTFIPDLSRIIPLSIALAITLVARVIALIGYGWAGLILVKGLALAHEVSHWRSLAVILLSLAMVYLLLPLSLTLVAGYLIH